MGVTPDEPTIPSLTATPTGCDFVSNWMKSHCRGKKVITVTLRETSYETDRNSSTADWIRFAHSLDPEQYIPVIVRDTEVAFHSLPEEMKDLTIFYEASWNMEIRAAFYQMSYLNLFSSGGPMSLAWFNNKCRCLSFKLITNSVVVATENHLKYLGYSVGDQLPYFSDFQKIVWDDDTYEVICREFKEMCIKIEENFGLSP